MPASDTGCPPIVNSIRLVRSRESGDASFHGGHAYEKAIALDPREALFHQNLGRALEKQSKLAEAEAAFKKASSPEGKLEMIFFGKIGRC